MARRISDFARLIAPCKPARFFSWHWGRRPLVLLRRDDLDIYRDLPTIGDYDFLLGSLAAPADGWFSLVKGSAKGVSKSALTRDGTLNLAEIYEAVGQGHSLLLTKLHRRERSIGDLCRQVEAELIRRGISLIRPIGANGYFTPRSAQGFAIHYDDHDVLILQLSGRKSWRIYRRVIDSPLQPPLRSLTSREVGKPIHEFTLSCGDLVYMPRGFAHEACTTEDVSLHLTLSLYPATWRDVFSEILMADIRFRRNLPIGFARGGALRAIDRQKLRRLSSSLPNSPAALSAATSVANRLLSESDISSGGLQQVTSDTPLTGKSRVKLADGVQSAVQAAGASAILHLPGASMKADRKLEEAFRYISRGREFRIRDLPIAADEESKLKLVTDLLRSGYLVQAAVSQPSRKK